MFHAIIARTQNKGCIMSKILFSLFMSLSLVSCNCEKNPSSTTNSTDKDKIIYTIGQMYARRIDYLRLDKNEVETLIKGAQDWLKNQKSDVDFEKTRPLVQNFIETRMSEGAKVEKEKGKKYLEEFLKKGGKLTSSGLAYEIVKPGSNVKPGPNDTVEVHYHGTFIDGTVFDSSVDRKEKANFPLDVVIKGWQEGMQLIGEGGEIKLVVPSDLAYGDRGSSPKIPGGATLLFDVTLFKITKR